MNSDSLMDFINARPFRPFRLTMADGRTVDVRHPELISYREGKRTAVVVVDGSPGRIGLSSIASSRVLDDAEIKGGREPRGR